MEYKLYLGYEPEGHLASRAKLQLIEPRHMLAPSDRERCSRISTSSSFSYWKLVTLVAKILLTEFPAPSKKVDVDPPWLHSKQSPLKYG